MRRWAAQALGVFYCLLSGKNRIPVPRLEQRAVSAHDIPVSVDVAGRSGSSSANSTFISFALVARFRRQAFWLVPEPAAAPVCGCESPASCTSFGCISFSANTHGAASRDGDEGVVLIWLRVVSLWVPFTLIRVKSPAPPIVALLGLLGMVLGEQLGTWIKTKRLDVRGAVSVCLIGESYDGQHPSETP